MTLRATGLPLFPVVGVLVVGFAITGFGIPAAQAVAADLDFNRDVRPILSDKCYKCHGPDSANQDSEFRVDSFASATADLGGYAGVVPGNLDASALHVRIHDPDDPMPPADDIKQLTDAEKEILDQWIADGAAFEAHWSFQPLPARVDVPEPSVDDSHKPHLINAIDAFVMDQIVDAGAVPTGFLSKEKWLRRITFDLTGLPPTLDQLDAFTSDDSAEAYQTVVDRLLRSDACAERLTSEWMDVARYSDTYGYQRDDERFVWPYRDWVIDAFRRNLPYDQFITWQLAGDLLPNATTEQRLATVFNRLHSHKKEGGVAIEEFRVENVADRTHTVAAAMLGLTMECSRCHDHKYDPITMQDYYGLSAFFDNVDENGLISYFTDAVPTPAMTLASPEQQDAIDQARARLAQLESELSADQVDTEFQSRFSKWRDQFRVDELIPGRAGSLAFDTLGSVSEAEIKNEKGSKVPSEKWSSIANRLGNDALTPKANRLVAGKFGNAIELTGDDAVVIPGAGHYGRHDRWTVSMWFQAAETDQRSVLYRRSRGWDDAGSVGYELTKQGDRLVAKLCHYWPGNAIAVGTIDPIEAGRWYHVAVVYDGSSRAEGLRIFINGNPAPTTILADHLTRNITDWTGGYHDLAIGSRYRDRGFKDGKVDQFEWYDRELSDLEVAHLFDGRALVDAIANHPDQLKDYFRLAWDPVAAGDRERLRLARKSLGDAIDAAPAITVMREQATPRQTYILERGVYDAKGETVAPQTPASLPAMDDDLPRNRLGLARWLTHPDHPLTARVAVNRYWQLLMGEGLVRTPEDFGNQGQLPTHPQLLDWLSRDFVDSGWDVHRLLKTIALSATYRRSPETSPTDRQRDPENRLLARGTDVRLTAEMIRDNVLATSGLLVDQVGGPPAKPYDLALAYTPLPVDQGDQLYRRSLYTFWKRTSPTPVMMTLNTPTREVCRMKREITNTPLQALVMMNGPQFVEAARVMAADLLAVRDARIDSRLDPADSPSPDPTWMATAFRRLTSRRATETEMTLLKRLFDDQREEFAADIDAANRFLAIGSRPVPPDRDPAELAAATVLIQSIMNLDEAVRHQR